MARPAWLLPVRGGTSFSLPPKCIPSAEASVEYAASCIATSTKLPLPLRSRAKSAVMTAP